MIGAVATALSVLAGLSSAGETAVARTATSGESNGVPQPDGFRLQEYDAPVPAALSGARTVTARHVRRLMQQRAAVVVDVIPQHRRPEVLADDQLWLPVEHTGIAGALWLPDTGFGTLDAMTEDYLFTHLRDATDGRMAQPVVFYCRIDCWMSWNAAKRALQAGYEQVYWFRDGIDDWQFEDLPTAVLQPEPGPRLPGDPG